MYFGVDMSTVSPWLEDLTSTISPSVSVPYRAVCPSERSSVQETEKEKSQRYPDSAARQNIPGLGGHCLVGLVMVCELHLDLHLELGVAFVFEEDPFEENCCLDELSGDRKGEREGCTSAPV